MEPDRDDVHVEHDPTVHWEPGGPETDEAREARLAGAFSWALVVERGPRAGLTYVLGWGETTAGRDAESDIFLGDVTVSRRHARFVVNDEGLHIEDLGSTNGIYFNGSRGDAFALAPDDEVMIGKYLLLVVSGSS